MSALEHMGMAGGPKMVVEEEAVPDYNGKSTLKEPRYKVYKTQLTFKWVRLRCLGRLLPLTAVLVPRSWPLTPSLPLVCTTSCAEQVRIARS